MAKKKGRYSSEARVRGFATESIPSKLPVSSGNDDIADQGGTSEDVVSKLSAQDCQGPNESNSNELVSSAEHAHDDSSTSTSNPFWDKLVEKICPQSEKLALKVWKQSLFDRTLKNNYVNIQISLPILHQIKDQAKLYKTLCNEDIDASNFHKLLTQLYADYVLLSHMGYSSAQIHYAIENASNLYIGDYFEVLTEYFNDQYTIVFGSPKDSAMKSAKKLSLAESRELERTTKKMSSVKIKTPKVSHKDATLKLAKSMVSNNDEGDDFDESNEQLYVQYKLELMKCGKSDENTISRLKQKIQIIADDPLFDTAEAEKLVKSKLEQMLKEDLDFRKDIAKSRNDSKSEVKGSNSDDDYNLDIFESTHHFTPTEPALDIIDFGTSKSSQKGIDPSKLLEEACRRIDRKSQLKYSIKKRSRFFQASLAIFYEFETDEYFEMDEALARNEEDARQYVSIKALACSRAEFGLSHTANLSKRHREIFKAQAEIHGRKAHVRRIETLQYLSDCVNTKLAQGASTQTKLQQKSFTTENKQKDYDLTDTYDDYNASTLATMWDARMQTDRYLDMLDKRNTLPVASFKEKILNILEMNNVVIVCGETGSGKSTQVPSFILEDCIIKSLPCSIICTEPRRISAISLANRVSEELGDNAGSCGTSKSCVGYAVRLDSKVCRHTRLTFVTTGLLLRMIEDNPNLTNINYLIIDEVHERNIESDFLLIVIKQLLTKRKDLRVILMSATIDSERISTYMNSCPVINISGRTFPIKQYFLEDALEITQFTPEFTTNRQSHIHDFVGEYENYLSQYTEKTITALESLDHYRICSELIVELLQKICFDSTSEFYPFRKSILVFLPGISEIRRLFDLISMNRAFTFQNCRIMPLHSSISNEEQQAVFESLPYNQVKIVLATNIAETGITIPDVTCVIDSGKVKEIRYDEKRQISRLVEGYISKASALQRMGRAGRVRPGICFQLFTRHRFERKLSANPIPEIMRLSLQELIMRVILCKMGHPEEFLSQALDPPPPENIRRALFTLTDVGALKDDQTFTQIGYYLALLPVDIYLGKLIIFGLIFGCLDYALVVAAGLSSKSIFQAPFGMEKQAEAKRAVFMSNSSDFTAIYNVYKAFRSVCEEGKIAPITFCHKHILSSRDLASIEDLRQQYLQYLADANLISLSSDESSNLTKLRASTYRVPRFFKLPLRYNRNIEHAYILDATIAAGLYPKIAVYEPQTKSLSSISNNQPLAISSTSVNSDAFRNISTRKFLVYYTLSKSSKVFINECAIIDPMALAILCGSTDFRYGSGQLFLDRNRVKLAFDDMMLFVNFRKLRSNCEIAIATILAKGDMAIDDHNHVIDLAIELLKYSHKMYQDRANRL